jgi:hypothetical protein
MLEHPTQSATERAFEDDNNMISTRRIGND